MNEMKLKKIALGEKLITECKRILNLSVDNGNLIDNGIIMDWNDMKSISLFNPIPYEDDRIDGVLLFGDFTAEFHLEKECDAINWANVSNDYISMIIEELKKNQCSKFV